MNNNDLDITSSLVSLTMILVRFRDSIGHGEHDKEISECISLVKDIQGKYNMLLEQKIDRCTDMEVSIERAIKILEVFSA